MAAAVRGRCLVGAAVEDRCSSGRNARTRAQEREGSYGTQQEHSTEHGHEPRSLRRPQSQSERAFGQELQDTHVPSQRLLYRF